MHRAPAGGLVDLARRGDPSRRAPVRDGGPALGNECGPPMSLRNPGGLPVELLPTERLARMGRGRCRGPAARGGGARPGHGRRADNGGQLCGLLLDLRLSNTDALIGASRDEHTDDADGRNLRGDSTGNRRAAPAEERAERAWERDDRERLPSRALRALAAGEVCALLAGTQVRAASPRSPRGRRPSSWRESSSSASWQVTLASSCSRSARRARGRGASPRRASGRLRMPAIST